jgi:hypothetical protein
MARLLSGPRGVRIVTELGLMARLLSGPRGVRIVTERR